MPKLHWKKKKLLTILANRRQHTRQFGTGGDAQEILTEAGVFVITQSSSDALPNYIITE